MFQWITGNEDITHTPNNTPSTAFVIIESSDGYMLLYNKYRNKWELAGGYVEYGELPKECAIRECKEESNQLISDLEFVGLAKYENMNAAIYYAYLNAVEPFTENGEIKELRWWKLGEVISEVCEDSIEFIKLYAESKT